MVLISPLPYPIMHGKVKDKKSIRTLVLWVDPKPLWCAGVYVLSWALFYLGLTWSFKNNYLNKSLPSMCWSAYLQAPCTNGSYALEALWAEMKILLPGAWTSCEANIYYWLTRAYVNMCIRLWIHQTSWCRFKYMQRQHIRNIILWSDLFTKVTQKTQGAVTTFVH